AHTSAGAARSPVVYAPVLAAGSGQIRTAIRVLLRRLLIHIAAEAWRVRDVHVAVLELGTARNHFAGHVGEETHLLDAEVGNGDVDVNVRGMGWRADVARTVPGCPHLE